MAEPTHQRVINYTTKIKMTASISSILKDGIISRILVRSMQSDRSLSEGSSAVGFKVWTDV